MVLSGTPHCMMCCSIAKSMRLTFELGGKA